jgi:hypothetical protein
MFLTREIRLKSMRYAKKEQAQPVFLSCSRSLGFQGYNTSCRAEVTDIASTASLCHVCVYSWCNVLFQVPFGECPGILIGS